MRGISILSSILKALKKLESETAVQDGSVTRAGINKWTGYSRTAPHAGRKKWIFMVAAILILAVFGALFTGKRRIPLKGFLPDIPFFTSGKKTEASNVQSDKPTDKPTDKPNRPIVVISKKTTTEKLKVPVPKISEARSHSDLPVKNDFQRSEPTPTASPAKKRRPPPPFSKAPSVPKRIGSPEPPPEPERKTVTETVRKTLSLPPEQIDEDRLKLHAIAWSNNPERRIAVINGRIVREGDSIDGFKVSRISAEEVIVKEGEKSWRLVFRLH